MTDIASLLSWKTGSATINVNANADFIQRLKYTFFIKQGYSGGILFKYASE
jgi:hypothetical protein